MCALAYMVKGLYHAPMITPLQCKLGRAALGWSVRKLATQSKVSVSAINRFEVGRTEPIPATRDTLQRIMEAAGVEFTNGDEPGVKLRAKP